MNVLSLRHTTTVLAGRRQAVPVDARHLFVRIGQHPRSEQATDAGTSDHRVRTDLPHVAPPDRDVGAPAPPGNRIPLALRPAGKQA
jgi:hypothetical protein